MAKCEWLETYLEGWRTGDPALSLGATTEGFFYDDSDTGRIAQTGFVAFFEAFMASWPPGPRWPGDRCRCRF